MKTLSTLILMAALGFPLCAQNEAFSAVNKLYVGSMGQSDEAERFKMLLEEELGKAGFTSVGKAEDADAILTGVLVVRVYDDESLARVTVVLKSRDGQRLWGKDFQPHFKLRGPTETVKRRAQDVAQTLKKDVTSAARKK